MDDEVIMFIRVYYDLPDRMTNIEVARAYHGTLGQAIGELYVAKQKLKHELAKTKFWKAVVWLTEKLAKVLK